MNLFADLREMQKHYPFQYAPDFFDDLKPTLTAVERKYLIPEIGNTLWQVVITRIETEEPEEDDVLDELIARLQHAAAHLTALYHMAKSNVVFTAAGLLVTKTEQMVPASEFRTKELQAALLRDVQDALDRVVEHLDANAAYLADMRLERPKLASRLLRTAAEFDAHMPISESKFIYRKLLPSLRYATDSLLAGHIGPEMVEVLGDIRAKDDPTADELRALTMACDAVANLTMGHAMPRLQQQLSPFGIALFREESRGRSLEEQGKVTLMMDEALARGESHLRELKIWLDRTASESVFPEYFNSDAYADPAVDHTRISENDDNFFAP